MPSTILANTRVTPRFAGISTFCRYPFIDLVPPQSRPLDWAIYGVPYDTGVTYRPGARFAPRAIRDASQYIKRYHLEHAVDVCDRLSLCDAGDAPIKPYELKATLDSISDWAAKLADPKTKLLAVGGDHSIAYANIKATWLRQGSPKGGLALLHFDSHLDTVDAVWGEKWGHASVFRRAIEDGFINPRHMLSVGIKGPLNTPDDLAYAKQQGITVVSAEQWHRSVREGSKEVELFVAGLKGAAAYLTFDIDVVDPAFAPGTGTPAIGGFTSAEVLRLLQSLKGANIVGADVVEVLPDRDVSGITALLAGQVIFEILALDAARR